MKRLLLFLTAVMIGGFAFAQKGEIIYTDFEPDLYVRYYPTANQGIGPDVLIDIDRDGNDDFMFYAENEWGLMISLVLKRKDWYAQNEDWKFRVPYLLYDEDEAVPIVGDPIQVDDVIAEIEGSWCQAYRFFYNLNWHLEEVSQVGPDDHCYISVRKAVEDGYCYGWLDAIIYIPPENQVDDYPIYLTICRMAYCTIPNYPLCVGQTDFSWTGLDGQGDAAFATLHPNPTSDIVTVSGQDLESAEAFNALGQRIASVKGSSGQLTIDLSGQPAGIYFVNVTDSVGRKCVKKVVKH